MDSKIPKDQILMIWTPIYFLRCVTSLLPKQSIHAHKIQNFLFYMWYILIKQQLLQFILYKKKKTKIIF